jgi:hypothetical protein
MHPKHVDPFGTVLPGILLLLRSPRDPIQYALETDWPLEAGGFEPLHFRIGIREDSQPGAAGFETYASQLKFVVPLLIPEESLKP